MYEDIVAIVGITFLVFILVGVIMWWHASVALSVRPRRLAGTRDSYGEPLNTYQTRADVKAHKQYLEGRRLALDKVIKSPSRWLSQYKRDAFLHGYRDVAYECGFLECDKLLAKEKGIVVIPNGTLPNGYYWVRPSLTNEQKAYHNVPLDEPVKWRLGAVNNNEVTFIGETSSWTVKDGQLSFMSFTNRWRGDTFVPHQFIQLQISPPEK